MASIADLVTHKGTRLTAGKWSMVTERTAADSYEHPSRVRTIFHYTTPMIKFEVTESGGPTGVITWEGYGRGSMSDKCGLSRIRQTILRHSGQLIHPG